MLNPLQSLSRRAALTLLGGAGAAASLPASAATLRIEDLSPSWFRDRVGEPFLLNPSGEGAEGPIEVVLAKVVERERIGRRVAPFTLLFEETGGKSKSDACFTIGHQRFQVPGVFVGRVLGQDDGQFHEVIFG
jgi:hypothetical protein